MSSTLPRTTPADLPAAPPHPVGRSLRFAIRDDDTNFFTRPAQLEAAYADLWDAVPITLSVVPFHASTRSKAIPPEHWQGEREFPLHENGELVSFLRDQLARGRVAISLHGYSHRNYRRGFEFQAVPDPEQRMQRGRAYLEDLLGTRVGVFVPPHNALSRRALLALDRVGLDALGSFLSFHPASKPWDWTTPGNYARLTLYRLRLRRGRAQKIVYPFPLRYRRHAEFGCHNLVPGVTAAPLLAGLEEARRAGGDFCLATHYWELDAALSATLRETLAAARRTPGIRFVAAAELFRPPEREVSALKALAVIPARGGSKAVPRKNLYPLGGQPLIAWSIRRALESGRLDRVIVSTDDTEIADVARGLGADVPFLRPAEFAQDLTPDLPVFAHALGWLAEHEGYIPDAVVHLRPTLPFRTTRQIDDVVRLLGEHPEADCVKSVYLSDKHPHKMWRLGDGRLEPYEDTELWRQFGPDCPRQMLTPAYWSAGLVDGIRRGTITGLHSTTGRTVFPYLVDPDPCVDLDTLHDFHVAEAVLAIARQEGQEWAH